VAGWFLLPFGVSALSGHLVVDAVDASQGCAASSVETATSAAGSPADRSSSHRAAPGESPYTVAQSVQSRTGDSLAPDDGGITSAIGVSPAGPAR